MVAELLQDNVDPGYGWNVSLSIFGGGFGPPLPFAGHTGSK